ncbi:MAG: LacI family transcriptional regulator [Frondihabitans sp.]|nr:LacI family transcriptional regulator [Frondihabitans sp.]
MAAVAAHSGVSLKTVSRVVNGEPGVRAQTVERVRSALHELGYRRNDAAAALARARPPAEIGLLIEDVSDTFYSRLTRGVQEVARAHGHLVILSSSEEDSALERKATLALAARGVAGLIVVPHSDDHAYLADEIDAGLSVVFVDRPPLHLRADAVLSDNAEGARRAVAHLLGLGHRRIAFVGNAREVYTSARRLEGFERAHADAGVDVDPALVVLGPREEGDSAEAVHRILRLATPPTALFTQNNVVTLGAWRAIRDAGAHMQLIGYDDFSMADLLDPPVSVVAQDPVELGRRAAELLFARLGGERGEPHEVVVPTRLIVRP